MKTALPAILFAAMSGFALQGCGARAEPDSRTVLYRQVALENAEPRACPRITSQLVRQGRQVYVGRGNCGSCHGASGQGGPLGPSLADSQWLNGNGSYASIAQVVRSGVARPKQFPAPMPAKGGGALSEQQVCAVAAYVYSISH